MSSPGRYNRAFGPQSDVTRFLSAERGAKPGVGRDAVERVTDTQPSFAGHARRPRLPSAGNGQDPRRAYPSRPRALYCKSLARLISAESPRLTKCRKRCGLITGLTHFTGPSPSPASQHGAGKTRKERVGDPARWAAVPLLFAFIRPLDPVPTLPTHQHCAYRPLTTRYPLFTRTEAPSLW